MEERRTEDKDDDKEVGEYAIDDDNHDASVTRVVVMT